MQFIDLQNLVAYSLDDLSFGYFTPVQVKVWLNNAQKRVQNRLLKAGENYYNLKAQTPLIASQREYVLPADFKKLMRLEVVMSGTDPNETVSTVNFITTNQRDLIQGGTGTPLFYTIRRNRLLLRPAPDTALTMRMEYVYQIADMVNDTDVPDVPDPYHELIALLAMEDGFLKDGKVNDLLTKKLAEFEKEMDSDSDERHQDGSRGIVETGASAQGFDW